MATQKVRPDRGSLEGQQTPERRRPRRDRRLGTLAVVATIGVVAVVAAATMVVANSASEQGTGAPSIRPNPEPLLIPHGPENVAQPPRPGPAPPKADYLLDLRTGETTQLPADIRGGWQNGYAVSPDGSEVAYSGPGGGMRHGEYVGRALLVARIDGTHVRQIADGAVITAGGRGPDMGPAWSPDGTTIAYVGRPALGEKRSIFVVDLTSGVTRQVTFKGERPQLSTDGSSIVYTIHRHHETQVRMASVWSDTGSRLVGAIARDAGEVSLSPDGSRLAYICGQRHQVKDLCLANADGSDPRVIAQPKSPHGMGGIVTASWSPDGSRLAYWTFFGVEGVYILDLATGRTTCVAGCAVGAWPIPAWPRWLDRHTLFVEAYHGPH